MMDIQNDNPRRLVRLPEVSHLTALPRATIYERIAADEFPRPVSIGLRSVAWRLADIYDWLDKRPVCVHLGARHG